MSAMQTVAQTSGFGNLEGHEYMRLTTFRKSGEGVPTPVWFAREGDRLYVTTQATSGKVKRISHTAQVRIEPCTVRGDVLGPAADGRARVVTGEEAQRANSALSRKYGLKKRLFELFSRGGNRTYLEITPA